MPRQSRTRNPKVLRSYLSRVNAKKITTAKDVTSKGPKRRKKKNA
jgi:hypothetical protein